MSLGRLTLFLMPVLQLLPLRGGIPGGNLVAIETGTTIVPERRIGAPYRVSARGFTTCIFSKLLYR